MTVHYELYCTEIAHTTDEVEIALPEDLTVTFGSPAYNLSELVVNIRNGNKSEQRKVKGKPLDLSDFLFAGKIELEIFLIAKGRPVKRWTCAPLVINEIEKGFRILDEIVSLDRRLTDVERKTQIIL